jgi:anti-anti-sigma factor
MLGILVHRNGDEVTLRCRGSILAGRGVDVLRFTTEMRRELIVTLDLVQVRSIDAAGIGLLVELHRCLRSSGRKLKVSRMSPRVRRMLRLVNLQKVLDLPDGHAAAA